MYAGLRSQLLFLSKADGGGRRSVFMKAAPFLQACHVPCSSRYNVHGTRDGGAGERCLFAFFLLLPRHFAEIDVPRWKNGRTCGVSSGIKPNDRQNGMSVALIPTSERQVFRCGYKQA